MVYQLGAISMNSYDRDIRILYVDDSPVIRDMVSQSLSNLGYTNTESAEDGVDALEKINENDFDFIITDINMPNMDGFEFTNILRNMLDYASTPILVLTTESSEEMKAKGYEVGATSWMVKPFDDDLLLSAIMETIEKVEEQ